MSDSRLGSGAGSDGGVRRARSIRSSMSWIHRKLTLVGVVTVYLRGMRSRRRGMSQRTGDGLGTVRKAADDSVSVLSGGAARGAGNRYRSGSVDMAGPDACLALVPNPLPKIVIRHGARDVVALGDIAAEFGEDFPADRTLDTFGDDAQT